MKNAFLVSTMELVHSFLIFKSLKRCVTTVFPTGGMPSPWSTEIPAFTQATSVFPGSMMRTQSPGFTQQLTFGTQAVPSWSQPGSFGPPVSQSSGLWAQPAQVPAAPWVQPSSAVNPFQSSVFAPSTLPAQTQSVLPPVSTTSPPQPPPRTAPQKELSKKESDAFIALDPLGDREMKDVKEMFKDFQLTKPPAVPARRGEQQSLSGASRALSNCFISKVPIPQDSTGHRKLANCPPERPVKSFLYLNICSSNMIADHVLSNTYNYTDCFIYFKVLKQRIEGLFPLIELHRPLSVAKH